MRSVYLDNNATTALDERVLASLEPWLRHVANAASAHQAGRRAAEAIAMARSQVAALLGAASREIIFTSGATEANNLALTGLAASGGSRRRLVTAATEHPAVLEPLRMLAQAGFELVVVPVDGEGLVDLDRLAASVDERTLLVSVMAANNETGVLAPIGDVSRIARAVGAFVHTDATQLVPWGPLSVDDLDVDLLSLSAHKMHGPQGVGALYVRRNIPVEPIIYGGGHERGLRSGTSNTAGIVGLGAAATLAASDGPAAAVRTVVLRDKLHQLLTAAAGTVDLNGHAERRLPGTVNLAFAETDAEAVMAGAPTVAVATGSACSTGHPGPSHVLTAMGASPARAASSLRFGLSRNSTDEDVTIAAALIAASVHTARERATSELVTS